MSKYIYPAIFTPEIEGGYSVRFPDVENCFTDADDLVSAMEMAKDVLCLMLYNLEQSNSEIPNASSVHDIKNYVTDDEFVTLVACDTLEYRRYFDNKAVKKTLSIPSWLNDMAERAEINFSATLQAALKQQLNIQ